MIVYLRNPFWPSNNVEARAYKEVMIFARVSDAATKTREEAYDLLSRLVAKNRE